MKIKITSYFGSAAIAAVLLCSLTELASADTVTVTNTNDSGPGSLRQALSIVNDGDTIDFAVTGTITLTSGELLVNDSITIAAREEGVKSKHLTLATATDKPTNSDRTQVFYILT